ncbi:hypothetical protein AGOR_G00182590 [Albula goreensis]|uniref:Cardiotrophin-like cytokine factor 1 n=1 Tax=Albula goreensis TaxID=1534307 RepID=A0A8T3CX27_9TELE|nr:hypothetical protein AGOR_G00182590 [Albula goreensis]
MRHGEVHRVRLALLLAAVMVSAQVPDPSLGPSNERSSIERTYELTKYLEHQLKEIKATYLTYLGPPFSDPDFSPPRPNTTALSLPSAATRLDLWRGLENRARWHRTTGPTACCWGRCRSWPEPHCAPTSRAPCCTSLQGWMACWGPSLAL